MIVFGERNTSRRKRKGISQNVLAVAEGTQGGSTLVSEHHVCACINSQQLVFHASVDTATGLQ